MRLRGTMSSARLFFLKRFTGLERELSLGAAKKILSEKTVDPQLVEEFEYYVKLYQIYFEWQNNNGNGDFYELCRKEGLAFEGVPVIYYKE